MKFLQQDIMVAQCSLHHNSTYFTNGYLDIAQKVLKDDTTFSVFCHLIRYLVIGLAPF